MSRPLIAAAVVVTALLFSIGGYAAGRQRDLTSAEQPSTTATTAIAPSGTATVPATTVAPPTTATTTPPPRFLDLAGWTQRVQALPHVSLPSDCPLPLEDPESMPNADRSYRGGVHQGIDFICMERGRVAVAALPGRVVLANNTFVDATVEDRQALLDEAQGLGRTPPWTLAFLFGRFVVLDHGALPGVGHVVTVYAHLDEIDPGLRPGATVAAGARLGEIGNRGTETGASGGTRLQSIHLHWELHIDDVFLGSGLTVDETRTLYGDLFTP